MDLDAFLAQQADQGQVDSQGDFTVSHNEAVRKLARFALPRTTAWVSKLVQAAVRWRCQTLYVNQGRTETSFHFVMADPREIPTEQQILQALVSAGLTGPRALDAFGLALRGMVEQSHMSFLLICPSSQGGEPKRIYAGAHYGRLSEQQRLTAGQLIPGGLSLRVHHVGQAGLRGLVEVIGDRRGARSITEELRTYAYMCPVPIQIDEKPLGGPTSPVAVDHWDTHRPLVASGWKELQHSPPRLPLPPCYEEKALSVRTHLRRQARGYGGSRDFAAAYVLTFRCGSVEEGYRRSQLLWLLDGVIVDSEEIGARDALELRLYANAEGLSTDLTGFRLVDSPEYRRRRLELLRHMVSTLESRRFAEAGYFFREDRDDHSERDDREDRDQLLMRRVKALAGGGAGGLATMALAGPLVGLLVAGGSALRAGLILDRDRSLQARIPQLEARLANSLKSLRELLERTIVLSSARGWSKDQSGRPAAEDPLG